MALIATATLKDKKKPIKREEKAKAKKLHKRVTDDSKLRELLALFNVVNFTEEEF